MCVNVCVCVCVSLCVALVGSSLTAVRVAGPTLGPSFSQVADSPSSLLSCSCKVHRLCTCPTPHHLRYAAVTPCQSSHLSQALPAAAPLTLAGACAACCLSSQPAMHGRLKSSVQPSAEEVAAKRAQIGKYVAAKDLFLSRPQQRSMDARTSELTAKLIELNPDFYSLWALRKEQLQHSITALSVSAAHRQPPQHDAAGRHICAIDWLTPPASCRLLRCWCCVLIGPIAPLSCARPSW